MSEEDIPCKSPYEPRPNPIPNPNPNPSPNPNPDISNDDENNNSINTCESLGTAISSMLGSVIRDFDSRADAVIRSQDHLSLVIDRLTGEAENLEIPFFENEIHSALMEMSGDKAPEPDSFTMAFWQSWGAADLGDFRPISLLRGLYKLMAKVLANRLMRVLNKVVAPTQNAFVMGRQILDASLIANEVIDSWQKRKEKGLISKFSVLVNGVPAGFFPSSKGLRQGDPLSPYLFVLGMEVLDALIRGAVAGGWLPLSWILLWFEAASGLRINLDKSEIIPVGVVEEIEEMAVELGCRVGSLPSQYLGLPLGAPNKAPSVWDGVEEKVRRRLAH
ncbi:hypothetical protein CK203_050484 [Vitis vinifera]|uniref:Uncharacterized protein n=1 Tax=Vitis vinifera TaxID=29760 RepID=A0A438H1V2_VITVI|nr:hypothetical protein CK203_050484 [Vitis vinifera]